MDDDLLEHERDPLNPDAERMALAVHEHRRQQKYSVPPERLTAPLQTQLTPSACSRFYSAAQRRHLTPSALLRVIVLEWLDQKETNGNM